jgi:D-arabinose 1-dehydrogenase-like Zn-dependent alcohol dehydrogenase
MPTPTPAPPADDDVAIDVEGAQRTAQGIAIIGRVVETGARATSLAGRRVLAGPIDPCGECEICRRGGAAVCPRARRRNGAIPLRVTAAARWLVPLGDGLDLPAPAGAAAAGDAAVAYTLYARTGLSPREPVVVTGASPIARFLVEILRAKGASLVVVVDPEHAAWGAWVSERGAAIALAAGDDDEARAAVAEALAAQGAGPRPWRVLATAPEAASRAAALAGPRATLTLLAPAPNLPGDLLAREVTVIGVAGAHPDLLVEVAAMCAKGEIDLVGGTAATPDALMRAVVTTP